MTQGRFLSLDGLRGLAALAVLAGHVGGPLGKAFPGAYLAVDFFFCLSGFVLAHAYGERAIGFGSFVQARMVRLYPLYAAGLALGVFAAILAGQSAEVVAIAAALAAAYLPTSAMGPLTFPLNAPAWSLFFEIVANAGWFPFRRAPGLWLAVAVGASACGIVAVDLAIGGVAGGGAWWSFYAGFARVAFSFLAGVLIYRLRPKAIRRAARPWVLAAALILLMAVPLPRSVADPVIVLVCFPALVLVGSFSEPARPADAGACRLLGDISYPLYAVHFPILLIVKQALVSDGLLARLGLHAHASLVVAPLGIALAVVVARLLDRLYDRPLRRWLNRPMQASSPASQAAN